MNSSSIATPSSSRAPKLWTILLLLAASVSLAACGGGGNSPQPATPTPTPTPAPAGSNVASITINSGPEADVGSPYIDGAFASVTLCAPGSTTNCQTIDGLLVDTGSVGLRVMSAALTVSLPQQTDSGGNAIVECMPFQSFVMWGPVQMADMTIAGEKAASLPVQVVGSSSFSTVPSSCSNGLPVESTPQQMGANGILGVGSFAQDCGGACAVTGASNPGDYLSCSSPTACSVATVQLAQQVQNPVALFTTDNNGVIIQFPAVSSPVTSSTGSLVFGIGTQSNNAVANVTVLPIDPNTGNFTTSFNGQTLTDASFLDSGSNGIFFLDTSSTGIAVCTDNSDWYCPASTQNLSATNTATNGTQSSVSFMIANADSLFANPNDASIPNLGGPGPNEFDWGMPFFFGRNVYTSIEGASTPAGPGPYWAY
jgi:hypothetical protein